MEKSALISHKTNDFELTSEPSLLLRTDTPYSSPKLFLYVVAITLVSFQYGYSLGVYSPVSKVLMQLFHDAGFPWSPTDKEPYNTIISTTP